MNILFQGLGKMGLPTAKRFIDAGHALHTKPYDETESLTAKDLGIRIIDSFEAISNFGELVVWLLVPHQVVESLLSDLTRHLPKNTIVVDAGNSFYKDSIARSKSLKTLGIGFVDLGTSGGVVGKTEGYCLMYGGDESTTTKISSLFDTLVLPRAKHLNVGPAGSGHYVKMIHNAIEYGMMQSLAEGYQMLEQSDFDLDLGQIGDLWQHGSINQGLLNRLCTDALRVNPKLDGIDGVVKKSGEADWTIDVAKELDIELPATEAAIARRNMSAEGKIDFSTKLLAAMRYGFGGHDINGK